MQSSWSKALHIVLLLVVAGTGTISSHLAHAQNLSKDITANVEEATNTLAGGQSREWVLTGWKQFMGGERDCEAGESHIFGEDGKLLIRRCVDGQVLETEHEWAMHVEDEIDLVLSVDGKSYFVRFRNIEEGTQMRLRVKADEKTEATTDRLFLFEPQD